jgi:hypothetical protein
VVFPLYISRHALFSRKATLVKSAAKLAKKRTFAAKSFTPV